MAKREPAPPLRKPESLPANGSAPGTSFAVVETESADLFDYGLLRDYLIYVLGSIRRHKLLGTAVFIAVVGFTAGLLAVLPKSYEAEAKLLAQRNQVSAALGNPGRSMPWDSDTPTRAATETILRRDNLLSLAKQTDLIENWNRTRSPAVRMKDTITRLFSPRPSDEEQLSDVVGLLDKRLTVTTGENTVTIAIEWPNAQMSARLVEAAQQNFLEARHVSEISSISEAISILEGHATLVRERVEQSADQLEKAMTEMRPVKMARVTAAPRPINVQQNQDVARIKVMLDAKRRTINDLEDFRQRRLTEMRAKLTEQRTIYSDQHPIILDLKQQLAAMEKQESLQIAALHQDEDELVAELAKSGAREARSTADRSPLGPSPVSGEILRLEREAARTESPAVENAKGELHFALAKYASLLDRIEAARMELDAARAAFKYRYSVLRPAEVPRAPRKPNKTLWLAAGFVLGLLSWVVAAVGADLRAGRVIERWQIERQLGIQVLSEVAAP